MAARVLLASVVLAVSFAGAVYLAGYTRAAGVRDVGDGRGFGGSLRGQLERVYVEPSWADPAAVALAILAAGVAAAIVLGGRVGARR